MTAINLFRSTSFRLALLYLLVFAFSVVVLLGFIYWRTEGFLVSQTEETINAEILGLSERYELLGLAGLIHIINERIANDTTRTSIYLLVDEQYQPLAGNLEHWPSAESLARDWQRFSLRSHKGRFTRKALVRHVVLKGGFHLLVGRDDTEKARVEEMIIKSLSWGFALTLVLGLFGGVLMSRGMLRRIEVINRVTREIMRGNLSRRIPLQGTGDEFDQHVQNLNDMLDRIEQLMHGVRQVSDNIAHDLRSPLNRLRGRLEVALFHKSDPEAYRRAIEQAIAGTDELIGTFNALLKIAQAEVGLKREEIDDLDLAVIARDMAELYEPLAEERGQILKTLLQANVVLSGDRHLLSQAVANLLDNAIKYTPEGGSITLSLHRNKRKAVLTVADTGPGIPPEAHESVLRRFYRLESSRNTPGSGLGLSLVAAVAKLHNAELRIADNAPGLRISLAFDIHSHGS